MAEGPNEQPTRLTLTLTPHADDGGYVVNVATSDLWGDQVVAVWGQSHNNLVDVVRTVADAIGSHWEAMRACRRSDRLFD